MLMDAYKDPDWLRMVATVRSKTKPGQCVFALPNRGGGQSLYGVFCACAGVITIMSLLLGSCLWQIPELQLSSHPGCVRSSSPGWVRRWGNCVAR